MTHDMTDVGIIGFGGYVPRYRLSRKAIAEAATWLDPAMGANVKGQRAVCDWDEDSITMAVEAARHCLTDDRRASLAGFYLASTTLPFADRQNSAVALTALDLPASCQAVDLGGSQRAGTSALLLALETAAAAPGSRLAVAADKRLARTGSPQAALYGHGAAALLVGAHRVIARLVGWRTLTRDFVDHFRQAGERYDYYWEERWVRDEGYLKIAVEAGRELLAGVEVAGAAVDRLIFAAPIRGVREAVAKALGIPPDRLADDLAAGCGDTGCAHPLLMLAAALERASPGQTLLVLGFGQGCDALLFRTTDAITDHRPPTTIHQQVDRGIVESSYLKFLSLQGGVEVHYGPRAEVDYKTAISAATRHQREFGALQAGRCRSCGTLQFPRASICVNPSCRALGEQEYYGLADREATVASFTEDWLAYTPHPPSCYGMLHFAEGVKLMAQFTSDAAGRVQVGTRLRMVFRIKDVDRIRGYQRYFWKAQPA